MACDAKSEYVADMIFYGIRDILDDEVKRHLSFTGDKPELQILDELNYMYSKYNGVELSYPFRVVAHNWLANVGVHDKFLFRGKHWNSMDNVFKGVPIKVVHQSCLVMAIIDNNLTIIKDRFGNGDQIQIDLKPYLICTKIDKILDRISD